ncbi:MAG TPA: outer membrane lipid asymmetry maintenance protein MlaD [Caulobacteraceae bacterium]|nr:outer membrane lipid asymmetry maintenance protein MlaD [Caulobacteraceae bacterium]
MAEGQWAETGVGAVVILAAAGFLAYSLTVGGSVHPHGYEVRAKFGQVGSLAPGAVVSVAGVKIGTVSSIKLDPKTYLATTTLDLDPAVPLPSDSTARIASDGLMGASHVVIEPGGATETLKPGGEIENTQGAVDVFSLISQFLRPQPSAGESAADHAPSKPAGD